MPDTPNTRHYGNNLDMFHRYLGDETIDLVYLDPPLDSVEDRDVLFATFQNRAETN